MHACSFIWHYWFNISSPVKSRDKEKCDQYSKYSPFLSISRFYTSSSNVVETGSFIVMPWWVRVQAYSDFDIWFRQGILIFSLGCPTESQPKSFLATSHKMIDKTNVRATGTSAIQHCRRVSFLWKNDAIVYYNFVYMPVKISNLMNVTSISKSSNISTATFFYWNEWLEPTKLAHKKTNMAMIYKSY